MSKKVKRIMSAALAAAVASTAIGYAMINSNEKTVSADNAETKKTIEETIHESVKFTSTGEDKEETVYVLSDANGNVTKTIVSDWLKNKDGSDKIEDKSDLKNIENVKSEASFTEGADNAIVWEAGGEDIYYQGETDKKLPVDVKVTYLLDGKEMSADEIAGRSGKVTIRFDYTNNEEREVIAGGIKTKMYVPFTMISGMILDGDKFSNVEVNSGKVISDGDKFIVVGLAFPGMEENLNLNSILNRDGDEKLSFPDTVEVTADVEEFSLALTLTLGSADLISQVNADNMDSLDDLKETVNSLVSATEKLQSGTGQVKNGLSELRNSFGAYAEGVEKLTSGLGDINNGVGQLNEKISAFPEGLLSVLNGIDTINEKLGGSNGAIEGADKLAEGAAQVDAGVAVLKDKAEDLASGIGQLTAGTKSIDDSLNTVLAAFEDKSAMEPGLKNGSKAVADGVEELSAQLTTMVASINHSIEENNAKIQGIEAILAAGMNPQTGAVLTDGETAYYQASLQQLQGANAALQTVLSGMNPEAMSDSLAALSNGAGGVADGVEALENGLTQLKKDGTSVVAAGMNQLNSQIPALTDGVNELRAGTTQLADGINTLSRGMRTLYGAVSTELRYGVNALYQGGLLLKTSINQLYDGTKTAVSGGNDLNAATKQVSEGISTLNDGAIQLDSGMSQFKEEAIDKVSGFVNGEFTEITERIKETIALANDYTIFSMAEEGKSTSVKFIYETEGISGK